MKHINKLIIESSPYLLQHAHNPVNWVPYSNLVFEEAKQCNKPIIISIGYSSCHWCHVMEHESFEDESIAAFMNEHFICVKVDREEHPDVDMVYMDVVQQIHGNGGWPLNCFALPDGRPFWGGTYFNPKQWKQLLDNIIVLFQENYNELENQAEQLKNGLISRSSSILSDDINSDSETDSSLVFQNLYNSFDHEKGGFKGAPKFPMPVVLRFLIYYGIHMKNNNAVKMVETTLLNMAKSGIYDQVGGGFARYATDSDWKVPHFEKMLYDNAQLISVYSDMFKLTGDRFYKTVIEQTIEFIDRELTASEGIFYSALDADSENKEGLYYTWTEDEFKAVLGHYASLAAEYYGVGGDGLWEDNRNIILRPASDDLFAQQHFLSADELVSFTSYCRNQLLKVRSERNPPGLDDKMIVSWNSLMISALIDSYTALGTEKYLLKAIVAAKFLLNNMKRGNGGLLHTWKNGVSQIDAFLDDYALTCEAFLKLYSITTHEFWLHETESLLNYVMEHFYDEQTNLFWFSEIGSKYVFARKTETHDGVIPSGNSIMAGIMQILGLFLHNENYISKSKKMLQAISSSSVRYPAAYANWVRLALLESQKLTLVAVVGANSVSVIKELSSKNLPGVVIFGSEQQSSLPYFTERFVSGKTLIYICKDNYCLAPVENVNEALKYLTSA